MLQATTAIKYNTVNITSRDGEKTIDLTNALVETNYFEDLLSPTLSATLTIATSYDIIEGLPIRGGEKVVIDLQVASGKFQQAFRVYKVSDASLQKQKETFVLNLVPEEYFTNDYVRVGRKYQYFPIDTHVREIIERVLQSNKIGVIEETSNSLRFYGNMKKPFHILQWLGPQSVSLTGGGEGEGDEGSEQAETKGTAGYLFYQNSAGFHFRSVDSLASKTRIQESSSDPEDIFTYSAGEVTQANNIKNSQKIIDYVFEKNIDMRKSLRTGMYANTTLNFSPETHEITVYSYALQDALNKKNKETLGSDNNTSFSEASIRMMLNISDEGFAAANGGNKASTSRTARSLSFARYNLLFSQGLNILIPCNTQLKAGDLVRCLFPELQGGHATQTDKSRSGLYLIKELRHHFSANQNTTSLKLVRDTYGVQ